MKRFPLKLNPNLTKNFRQPEEVPEKRHTLLLVDDEKDNLGALKIILETEYNVLTALSGELAIELIKDHPHPESISMIISDQRMPGMSGVSFLKRSIEILPNAIRMILTGFMDIESAIEGINDGQLYQYLTKPIDPYELIQSVKRGLETFDLEEKNKELIIDLQQKVVEKEKMVNVFERFVPRQFLDRIAEEGIESIKLGKSTLEKVTIMFCDIRSFTSLAESMPPENVFVFLNSYLERMEPAVKKHQGYVDKFIGDAMMVLFDMRSGSIGKEIQDSIEAGIEMQQLVRVYNGHRKSSGYRPISIGIGIHHGEVLIGTLGSQNRMETTAVGDAVNVAARLESLTKYYRAHLITSEASFSLLPPDFQPLHRTLDYVKVKGKNRAVKLIEIFESEPPEQRAQKESIVESYHLGLEAVHQRQWEHAIGLFETCLKQCPDDQASVIQMERCRKFQASPPPPDWDGATNIEFK